MNVIRKYKCEGFGGIARHYAQVRLDDNSTVEVASPTALTNPAALALASNYVDAITEAKRTIYLDYNRSLYTIAGQDLSTVTLSQLITYVQARSTLWPTRLVRWLCVPLALLGTVIMDVVTRQERVRLDTLTVREFTLFCARVVAAYPAWSTQPVTDALEVEVIRGA